MAAKKHGSPKPLNPRPLEISGCQIWINGAMGRYMVETVGPLPNGLYTAMVHWESDTENPGVMIGGYRTRWQALNAAWTLMATGLLLMEQHPIASSSGVKVLDFSLGQSNAQGTLLANGPGWTWQIEAAWVGGPQQTPQTLELRANSAAPLRATWEELSMRFRETVQLLGGSAYNIVTIIDPLAYMPAGTEEAPAPNGPNPNPPSLEQLRDDFARLASSDSDDADPGSGA